MEVRARLKDNRNVGRLSVTPNTRIGRTDTRHAQRRTTLPTDCLERANLARFAGRFVRAERESRRTADGPRRHASCLVFFDDVYAALAE